MICLPKLRSPSGSLGFQVLRLRVLSWVQGKESTQELAGLDVELFGYLCCAPWPAVSAATVAVERHCLGFRVCFIVIV